MQYQVAIIVRVSRVQPLHRIGIPARVEADFQRYVIAKIPRSGFRWAACDLPGGLAEKPLAEKEQEGVKFATSVGANSLAELRATPADELLAEAQRATIAAALILFVEDVVYSYTETQLTEMSQITKQNVGRDRGMRQMPQEKQSGHHSAVGLEQALRRQRGMLRMPCGRPERSGCLHT